MTDVASSAGRQRTSREDGRQNMIEATIELLRTSSPDEITVREIAELSGHHHRFVAAWFGGKVGLFRAVFDHQTAAEALAVSGPGNGAGGPRPEILQIVRLMNWLVAAEPGCLDGPRPTPLLDRSIAIYRETYGLTQETARLMALRTMGGAISATLFAGPLGINAEDLVELADLEARLLGLLAAAEPEAP